MARRSVGIIGSRNTLMRDVYRREGVEVAEAGRRFASEDLTTMRSVPGLGRVPVAVERICRWTWACSDPPIGHDDHAKPAGYGTPRPQRLSRPLRSAAVIAPSENPHVRRTEVVTTPPVRAASAMSFRSRVSVQ